jgi:hypothetical protein
LSQEDGVTGQPGLYYETLTQKNKPISQSALYQRSWW